MNASALLAGLFSGIIGSMGLGGGAVLIIYLRLFTETEQLAAQGINLLFFIPTAVAATIIYAIKGKIRWKISLKLAAYGLLGTAVGWSFTLFTDKALTSKIFGVMLLILGIKELFKRNVK